MDLGQFGDEPNIYLRELQSMAEEGTWLEGVAIQPGTELAER